MIHKALLPLNKKKTTNPTGKWAKNRLKKAPRKGNTNDPEQRHLSSLIM